MRWFVLIAIVGSPFAARAAEPRDELLRLVPNDTAICLVVQGLRDRSKAVGESPLADWIGANAKSTLGTAPELQKLKEVETLFSTFLGVTPADLRDEIFGDAIVLGYQPGPPGKPDGERGFVMLKARDPAKLAALVDKLNSLQKSSGELTSIDARTHRDRKYQRRSKGDAGGEYYLLDDGLFVFAAQEAAIHSVIDRRLDAKPEPGLVAKSAARLGVDKAFLYCWFNPRRLDAEVMAHVAAAANERERATRRQFARIWSAADDLAIYLDAGKELELGFAAAYRADAMPAELKAVLASPPRPSALWSSVPEKALAAFAGRASGNELLDAALSFAPAEDRAAARKEIEKAVGAVVGKDKASAMLGGVGPDWAVWATPPTVAGGFPGVTAAVRLDATDATVSPAVLKTVQFYLQLLQVQYNREHDDAIESKSEQVENAIVESFSNATLFPPGYRPAFGLVDGHIVFASSPELVGAFRVAATPKAGPRTPFLRVSGEAFREYFETHGPALAKWVADRQDRPVAEVAKEFQTISEVLKAFDRGEVFIEGSNGVMKLAVRVKFVKPLSK
ncbi:MAG: hypothetical protein JNK93_18770 [Planctomycetia bacterium]|nr:hypothetical protein [Planctomycetia bacterium]